MSSRESDPSVRISLPSARGQSTCVAAHTQRPERFCPRNVEPEKAGAVFSGERDGMSVAISWTLPIPARFVIDRQGFIQTAEADPAYTTRPEPDDTLRALRTLVRERPF